MRLRHLLAVGALLTLLVASSTPASAEEAKMNALQTALSSTTISGYVDTSVEWSLDRHTTVQPPPGSNITSMWRSFRIWLRAHHWR